MSKDDDIARAAVLATLQQPLVQQLHFQIGIYSVEGYQYNAVTDEIMEGNIQVTYEDSIGEIAYYDSVQNEIILGFTTTGTDISHEGLVIHECTHALLDTLYYKFKNLSNLESEAMAYVAQCMYVMAKLSKDKTKGQRLVSKDKETDEVLEVAWDIAYGIFFQEKGHWLINTWGEAKDVHIKVDPQDSHLLEKRLKRHSVYKDTISDEASYDGVRPHHDQQLQGLKQAL